MGIGFSAGNNRPVKLQSIDSSDDSDLTDRTQSTSVKKRLNRIISDKISCLPDHLIDHILSYLPIKESGRTSVLSSQWRNKWSTQPDLVFNGQCISALPYEDPSVIEGRLLKMIDQVLLLHCGPINMFELSDHPNNLIRVKFVSHIDRWILLLTRKSVKHIVLNIVTGKLYLIPWYLFSCQSLHELTLYFCWLKPPATFKGFRNLKNLCLKYVQMTQNVFENLISGCPLLEKLRLKNFEGFTQINIHAPNLKFCKITGEIEDINFDNTFQLVNAYFDSSFNSKSNQGRLHGYSSNLLKFFNHLPQIQKLEIINYFLKYLAGGVVPTELPTPSINLTFLVLVVNFNDLKEISVVLCLLKTSPNLQKLEIVAMDEEETGLLTPASDFWEDIFSGPTISLGLRHASIEDFSGTKFELDFIKFLLLYSPALEKLIVKSDVNVKPEVMLEISRFKRASIHSEIIYHESDS